MIEANLDNAAIVALAIVGNARAEAAFTELLSELCEARKDRERMSFIERNKIELSPDIDDSGKQRGWDVWGNYSSSGAWISGAKDIRDAIDGARIFDE